MKKYLFSSLSFFAPIVLTAAAQAATITQTANFGGTPNLSQTLTFEQFDDLGGARTLLSIGVISALNIDNGLAILDNDGEEPAQDSFEFGAKGDISSTDVSLLDILALPVTGELEVIHSETFNLAPNVDDGPGILDPSLPDGMKYFGSHKGDSDSGFIGRALFGEYTGTGTYDIVVDVSQWQDFGGTSGVQWALSPVTASGNVSVVYEYIPEPSVLALLGGCGVAWLIACGLRSRRRT